MPLATNEQVPKPLTYALMYHVIWAIVFSVTALGLAALFLSTGWSWSRALLPPAGVLLLGLLAATGVLVLFVVRVRLMTDEIAQRTAYAISQATNWAVLIFGPVFLLAFRWLLEPLARSLTGVETWPITASITAAVVQVEVAVWWLSHVLSSMQLGRARRRVAES